MLQSIRIDIHERIPLDVRVRVDAPLKPNGIGGHIAAALAGSADLIASGDKRDLLPLGSIEGIEIVTAREALQRLRIGAAN